LALVIAAIGSFALSMWRLHRQMAAAKRRYVAASRRLYAEAYAPIREQPDVEALAAASTALSVAQSLDERAAELPTWPIDDGTARFIAVIITGVITSLIVRALFAAIGF
jgi:ABC-type amino acid transport system permease subunit